MKTIVAVILSSRAFRHRWHLLSGTSINIEVATVLIALRSLSAPLFVPLAGIAIVAAHAAREPRYVMDLVRDHRAIAICFIGIMVFAVLNAPEYHYRPVYYGMLGISSALLGFGLSKSCRALQLAGFLYSSYVLVLVICASIFGAQPEDINGYFPHVSRNGISAVCIFLQIFYSAAYFSRKGGVPLLTPLLTMAISVMCYGRSGTAFAFLILFTSCVQAILAERTLARPLATLTLGALMIAFALVGPQISESAHQVMASISDGAAMVSPQTSESAHVATTRSNHPSSQDTPVVYSEWARKGFQSIRWTMVRDYLSSLGVVDIIFGGNMYAIESIRSYNLNPHNSFIRGHAYFGLPYFVLLLAIALEILRNISRGNLFLVALMAIYAGRALVDAFALFDALDFVFFFAMFTVVGPSFRSRKTLCRTVTK